MKPRRGLAALAVAAASAACSPKVKVAVEFTCESGQTVRAEFRNDSAFVSLPGREVALAQAVSASGARYSDGSVEVWNKGEEITVSQGDSVLFRCAAASRQGAGAGMPRHALTGE